jgi:hypothetical protein
VRSKKTKLPGWCDSGSRVPPGLDRRMEDAFKCFGDDDFDVKKWVNAQVRSGEAMSVANPSAKGSSVDDHLATLVVKLQLLTQSSSKTIDEHSTVCPLPHMLAYCPICPPESLRMVREGNLSHLHDCNH